MSITNLFKKTIIKAWLPVIMWCMVIFYFSHQPNASVGLTPLWNFVIAKFAHISEYFILTLLIFRAFKKNKIKEKIMYFSVSFSFLYACSDEFHQLYIIGRHASIRDLFIDSIGIFLAIILLGDCRQSS